MKWSLLLLVILCDSLHFNKPQLQNSVILTQKVESTVLCVTSKLRLGTWDYDYPHVLSTELQDGEQEDYDSTVTHKDHIYDNQIQISVSGVFKLVKCYVRGGIYINTHGAIGYIWTDIFF